MKNILWVWLEGARVELQPLIGYIHLEGFDAKKFELFNSEKYRLIVLEFEIEGIEDMMFILGFGTHDDQIRR